MHLLNLEITNKMANLSLEECLLALKTADDKTKKLKEEYDREINELWNLDIILRNRIDDLMREEEVKRIEAAAFDFGDFSSMTKSEKKSFIQNLRRMTTDQVEYIAYKVYGYGNYPSRLYFDKKTCTMGHCQMIHQSLVINQFERDYPY